MSFGLSSIMEVQLKMKFNVYPNYEVPIDYIYYDEFGEMHVKRIGRISTPDIHVLKDDHYNHIDLVQP